MIYAQIKNNKVMNMIVVDGGVDLIPFSEGYDYFLEMARMDVMPSIGWSYDGVNFTPPPPQPTFKKKGSP